MTEPIQIVDTEADYDERAPYTLVLGNSTEDSRVEYKGEMLPGMVGSTITLGLFALFTIRGFRIALMAEDPFGTLLAVGITTMISMQVIINMGVVLGLLPTKGLTLPFISYGGTSLLVNAMGVGILLNISSTVRRT